MTRNQRSQATANDIPSLLAALPDVVLVLDGMGRIDFASAGSARYLSTRPRDWIGLSALDRLHPEDVGDFVERLTQAQCGEPTPTQALPLRVLVGDNKWQLLAAHGFVQINIDGFAGTLVMFRDTAGGVTNDSARQAAFESVFNRAGSHGDAHQDDRTWITTELLPQVLNNSQSGGPMTAVIVMTLADPSELSQRSDPTSLENPIGALAQRVRKMLRPRDLLTRLGDSQLVILCSGIDNCSDGLELVRRLHQWCSPSPLGDACPASLPFTTGCAFASQGDNAADVLEYAASTDGQVENGRFELLAA